MSQTSGGRRRWFQFTLRGLILFVALVGAAAAWIGYQRRASRREAPIAEQLRNQGAYVAFVGPFLRPEEFGPDRKPGVIPAWWRQGLSDLCGPRIRMFHWSSQSTTTSNVYFVNNQSKHFNFSTYPRFDLAPLAELSRLDDVGVHFRSIDDLSPLADFKLLRNLNLSHTGVSDLGPLAKLTQLETLDLTYTRVHDLAPLAKLTRLKQLYLPYATLVRDITPLAGLQNLELLDLERTHVVDLSPLAGLKKLETLNVKNTPVSDLTPLVGLNSLQSLSIRGAQVDERSARRVAPSLPGCKIDADYRLP